MFLVFGKGLSDYAATRLSKFLTEALHNKRILLGKLFSSFHLLDTYRAFHLRINKALFMW